MDYPQDLEHRVAIVTGAGVAVSDLHEDTAARTESRLKDEGLDADSFVADVTREESVRAMVDAVLERWGHIDILVNNAGISNFDKLPDTTTEQWNKVVATNLNGTHFTSMAVIPHMVERRYGRIVNISSLGGQVGGLKVAPDYVASKAGVVGLAKSYARYGAQYGITSNAICPGPTATEMAGDRFDPETIPLGRLAKPEDIANAVYFLVSPLADYITGATLDVNGGLHMR
jgi:NAD(P)-dependent dehydrogenase (short-subunit alcohol dehydrogenase family)